MLGGLIVVGRGSWNSGEDHSPNLKDEGDSLREKKKKGKRNINEKTGEKREGLDVSFYLLDFRNRCSQIILYNRIKVKDTLLFYVKN